LVVQDGIRAWGFAGEGRPSLEQTTLEGATWAREKVEGLVLSSAVSEVGDFTGFLKLFIEKIDSGSLDFTAQMTATLRGYETFVGQQLTALVRMMLLSDLITQVQADKDD
jgi:hypothetical protein